MEIISDLLFYRAEDGRFIIRPWGKYGKCYVANDKQRMLRSKIHFVFYILLMSTIMFCQIFDVNVKFLYYSIAAFGFLHQVLLWLYTKGLSITTPPQKPSVKYMKDSLRNHNRRFGFISWVSLALSILMSSVGILGFMFTKNYQMLLGGIFFALFSAFFIWQIKNR